ncbi:MAG: hypothetical protein NTV32_09265 [Gammaproteobacteria bacterium]|nr:hypothetical protein [Gammaproteobacteria bacterium]
MSALMSRDGSERFIELTALPLDYFSRIQMPVLEVPPNLFQPISFSSLSVPFVADNSAVTQMLAQLQAEGAERSRQINAFSNLLATPWFDHHFNFAEAYHQTAAPAAPASEASPDWDTTVDSSTCAAPAA